MTGHTRKQSSFLGTGWRFPPSFRQNGRDVATTSGEEDIHASLEILFGTMRGERSLSPRFGLSPQEFMFEPGGTTTANFMADRIRTAILIYEPRILLLSISVEDANEGEGALTISIEYEVRATNSRFNLVYPFYKRDGSEVRPTVRRLR